MLAEHADWVKKETLAVTLETALEPTALEAGEAASAVAEAGAPGGFYREELKVNGLPVTVEIARA